MNAIHSQKAELPILGGKLRSQSAKKNIPQEEVDSQLIAKSDWRIYFTDSEGTRHLVHYPTYLPDDLVEILRKLASGHIEEKYHFLSISQVAAILFIPEQRLSELISNGTLKAYKRDNKTMISCTVLRTGDEIASVKVEVIATTPARNKFFIVRLHFAS